jgi:S1-C subfamily serine protease
MAALVSCTSHHEPAPRHPAAPLAHRAPAPAPVAAREMPPGTIQRGDLLAVLDLGIPRFLQHIDTEPELQDHRFVGFRLTSFFPGDARFRAVDLHAGDVVTKINGLPIERPEHAYRIWQELRVASELTVEYLRDGAARQIRYSIVDG